MKRVFAFAFAFACGLIGLIDCACSSESGKDCQEDDIRIPMRNTDKFSDYYGRSDNFAIPETFHYVKKKSRYVCKNLPRLPVFFNAYTRENPQNFTNELEIDYYKLKKVAIYVHGYNTQEESTYGIELKNQLFRGTDDIDCVILLDWRNWSTSPDSLISRPNEYKEVALKKLPKVAECLAKFLEEKVFVKKKRDTHVHLLGFSLGAHLVGTAAKIINISRKIKIKRISALDPAGPIFEHTYNNTFDVTTSNTVTKDHAEFVDVIHASTSLGMLGNVGHVDHFIEEIECDGNEWCLHLKAVEYYIKSLYYCSFVTCPTEFLEQHREKGNFEYTCKPGNYSYSSLGYLSEFYQGRGEHKVNMYYINSKTNSKQSKTCTYFKQMERLAKNRVCKHGPNELSMSCKNIPYMKKCKAKCDGNVAQPVQCTFASNSDWEGPQSCIKPTTLTCLDENLKAVDMFVNYKGPNMYKYFYSLKSKFSNDATDLTMGKHGMDSSQSMLGLTMNRIKRSNGGYVIYNDKFDESKFSDFYSPANGHSKGILVVSSDRILFITHSIPSFPKPLEEDYAFPTSGKKYAQHVLCVSVDYEEEFLSGLILEMKSFKPFVYSSGNLETMPPNITDLAKKLIEMPRLSRNPSSIKNITHSSNFKVFVSKGTKKGKERDATKDIATHFSANVKVQTWEDRSSETWKSDCNEPFVENIKSIKINGEKWLRSQDHSKWLVSGDNAWFCAGDLNRNSATMARGGLFVCFNDYKLGHMFNGIIENFEACDEPPCKRQKTCYQEQKNDLTQQENPFISSNVDREIIR